MQPLWLATSTSVILFLRCKLYLCISIKQLHVFSNKIHISLYHMSVQNIWWRNILPKKDMENTYSRLYTLYNYAMKIESQIRFWTRNWKENPQNWDKDGGRRLGPISSRRKEVIKGNSEELVEDRDGWRSLSVRWFTLSGNIKGRRIKWSTFEYQNCYIMTDKSTLLKTLIMYNTRHLTVRNEIEHTGATI